MNEFKIGATRLVGDAIMSVICWIERGRTDDIDLLLEGEER